MYVYTCMYIIVYRGYDGHFDTILHHKFAHPLNLFQALSIVLSSRVSWAMTTMKAIP